MKRGRPAQPEKYHPDSVYQRARRCGYDQRAGDPFGRLAIAGHFPDYILNTVSKMNEIYADWYGEIDMKPWPASPSFEVGSGRSPVHENDPERAELAKRSFDRLQNEMSRFPPRLRFAIEELCIYKRACPELQLPYVKAALEIIAAALGYKVLKKRLDKSRRVSN